MHVKVKIRLLNSSGNELQTKITELSFDLPIEMINLREKMKVIEVAQMKLHIKALNDDLSGWDDYVRSAKDIGPIKYWVCTGNT